MKNNKLIKGILVFALYLIIPMIIGQFLPSLNNSTMVSILIRFLIDLAMIIGFIYIYKDDFKMYNKSFKDNPKRVILIGVLFAVLAIVAMPICNIILHVLNVSVTDANNDAINSLYGVIPLYMAFQTLIFSPIVEGITFRKVFKDNIKNVALFIIISGLVFGFYKIAYSFSSTIDLLQIIPYFAVGSLYAWAYAKSDNIYSSFIATFIYTLFVFIINLI